MIYFDNAATTYPKPESISEEVRRCITEYCGNPGRGSHYLAAAAAEKLYECRCEIAAFLGYSGPENIIFTPNATFALNLAIKTRARQGSHILISDQEHNAVLRPVLRLAHDGVVSYSVYSSVGNVRENIRDAVTDKSDILICNLVSNITGNMIPLNDIIAAAAEHKLYLIVDGSQWLGHGEIPPEAAAIDALCAPGHKGLFGIQGSGFLRLRSAEGLTPFLDGGSGSDSKSPGMPETLPERYEAGTVATPAVVSLREGIRFVRRIGYRSIENTESALINRACDILASFPSVGVWVRGDRCGSVLSFSDRNLHPDTVANLLDRVGICARSGFHCAPLAHRSAGTDPRGTVRVSFSIFNTHLELEAFYKALKNIIKQ